MESSDILPKNHNNCSKSRIYAFLRSFSVVFCCSFFLLTCLAMLAIYEFGTSKALVLPVPLTMMLPTLASCAYALCLGILSKHYRCTGSIPEISNTVESYKVCSSKPTNYRSANSCFDADCSHEKDFLLLSALVAVDLSIGVLALASTLIYQLLLRQNNVKLEMYVSGLKCACSVLTALRLVWILFSAVFYSAVLKSSCDAPKLVTKKHSATSAQYIGTRVTLPGSQMQETATTQKRNLGTDASLLFGNVGNT